MKAKELQALLQLLDDPDELIYEQVKTKIMSMGDEAIPHLESAWEQDSFGVLFQERVENIIHTIQFSLVKENLEKWNESDEQDLLEAMLLIARYQYPDYNFEKVKQFLEQLRKDVWLELNMNLTALERIKVINHILFELHGFSGNTSNYHAPQNSFINDVLETRKGNPISLSVIYLLLAKELKLPIYGINLPQHFVLAYLRFKPFTSDFEFLDEDILFYVNPFSQGNAFGKEDLLKFLKQLHLPAKKQYYLPCNNQDIIKRVLNNLLYSYKKLGYPEKVAEIQQLYDVVDKTAN